MSQQAEAVEIDDLVAPETLYVGIEEGVFDEDMYIEASADVVRLCGTQPDTIYEYRLVRKLSYKPSYRLDQID